MAESTNTTASDFSSLSSDDDPDTTHAATLTLSFFKKELSSVTLHMNQIFFVTKQPLSGEVLFLVDTFILRNQSTDWDNLFVRTNVYSFGLTELLARTVKGRVLVVLTSDGIKDLVKSNFIGQAFQNLPQTIRAMSSAIGGSMNNSPRRSILNCMNDLIPRPTDDAHDRCAKEYLEKLVALCNTASPTTADSNSIDSPSEYTDNLIAVEALCDIAILKGSTDDISVSPRNHKHQQPYDVFWNTETQKWSLVPPRHHDLELVLPQRNHPKPPPMIQKLLAAVAAAGNRKSPVALQPITHSEPLPALQPLQFGEASTVSIGWGVAAASAIETSALASFERVSADYSIDSDEMCITPVAVGASNMELSTLLYLKPLEVIWGHRQGNGKEVKALIKSMRKESRLSDKSLFCIVC
ncbi:hypothetical protein BCR33DRAFT_744054 [Rhizoclosmatium globosum]|uniref:Uncharacterized protein n=1 Tax=Rhizoclosmatium globosum TaxID=329046 RepID=A0A1Y2BC24_9FUNG|nr:hypothetical protein BCR33DRAFT_744054 [Rhizoclosmatium globosum]|eukprot:ORY32381.1 hypothetical protein BCR33DRAFT_744054 [Rhizoclosmatium globosum]